VKVRRATGGDRHAWRLLRRELWPACSERKHTQEMRSYLEDKDRFAVFLAERSDGSLAGFVEVSMRPDHRPGINPRIGYLEGLFVDRKDRRRGVARALVRAAEGWAQSQGAREMGSDTHPNDRASRATHRALGYRERERLVVFEKRFR
jgi:aminoglycoside 6'-N-acetyltransferase I